MSEFKIVLDTNVIVAALYSQLGASYKLLSLVGTGHFQTYLSVALFLEYEDVVKRRPDLTSLTNDQIDDILDYLCAESNCQRVHFLWRPFLKDPKDDMVLELAVAAQCQYIVTFNIRDFRGVEQFGLTAITPGEFLRVIGEIK